MQRGRGRVAVVLKGEENLFIVFSIPLYRLNNKKKIEKKRSLR